MNGRLSIAALAFVATVGLVSADPLVPEGGLRPHTGFLPDGTFGFALKLTEDIAAAGDRPALPAGSFVLHVERQRHGAGEGGQGQAQMQALLSDLQPGDVAHLVVLLPDGTRDRVTVTQPSLADLAAEERTRRLEAEWQLSEASRLAGDPFGGTYWGILLRNIALGNFELLHAMGQSDVDLLEKGASALMGNELAPLAALFGDILRLEARTQPQAGLVAGYALSRVPLLGDCGESLVEITQVKREWVEYYNGFGTKTGSSLSTETSRSVEVPAPFAAAVRSAGFIDVNPLMSGAMFGVLLHLSCDDPLRIRLEENMARFYAGQAPFEKGPLPP